MISFRIPRDLEHRVKQMAKFYNMTITEFILYCIFKESLRFKGGEADDANT